MANNDGELAPDPRYADFDVDQDIEEALEPAAVFKLGGREWHIRHSDEVSFAAVADMWLARSDAQAFAAVVPFFKAALLEEEFPAFLEMLYEPSSPFTIKRMHPTIKFVSEALFGADHPTEPAAPSSRGRSGNARRSTGGSSSRGTPRRRSAS